MKVGALMSKPPVTVTPEMPIREAAALMKENGVGALPVLEDREVVGIVTDRDMVVSVLATRQDAGDQPVREAMTSSAISCMDTQPIEEAAYMMGDAQVERLLVNDQLGRLVGMITVGDIAVNASEVLAGQAVGEICEDRSLGRSRRAIRPRE